MITELPNSVTKRLSNVSQKLLVPGRVLDAFSVPLGDEVGLNEELNIYY